MVNTADTNNPVHHTQNRAITEDGANFRGHRRRCAIARSARISIFLASIFPDELKETEHQDTLNWISSLKNDPAKEPLAILLSADETLCRIAEEQSDTRFAVNSRATVVHIVGLVSEIEKHFGTAPDATPLERLQYLNYVDYLGANRNVVQTLKNAQEDTDAVGDSSGGAAGARIWNEKALLLISKTKTVAPKHRESKKDAKKSTVYRLFGCLRYLYGVCLGAHGGRAELRLIESKRSRHDPQVQDQDIEDRIQIWALDKSCVSARLELLVRGGHAHPSQFVPEWQQEVSRMICCCNSLYNGDHHSTTIADLAGRQMQ